MLVARTVKTVLYGANTCCRMMTKPQRTGRSEENPNARYSGAYRYRPANTANVSNRFSWNKYTANVSSRFSWNKQNKHTANVSNRFSWNKQTHGECQQQIQLEQTEQTHGQCQ